jgi:hypothetical protein
MNGSHTPSVCLAIHREISVIRSPDSLLSVYSLGLRALLARPQHIPPYMATHISVINQRQYVAELLVRKHVVGVPRTRKGALGGVSMVAHLLDVHA